MSSEGRCALFCLAKEGTLKLNMSHRDHCTCDAQVEIAVKAALVLLAVSIAKSLLGVSRCYEQHLKTSICCLMATAQITNHYLKQCLLLQVALTLGTVVFGIYVATKVWSRPAADGRYLSPAPGCRLGRLPYDR